MKQAKKSMNLRFFLEINKEDGVGGFNLPASSFFMNKDDAIKKRHHKTFGMTLIIERNLFLLNPYLMSMVLQSTQKRYIIEKESVLING